MPLPLRTVLSKSVYLLRVFEEQWVVLDLIAGNREDLVNWWDSLDMEVFNINFN